MKVLGKILFAIILIPYIAVVVFLTACLLNYNDYNVTVFGNKSLIIIGEYDIEGYKSGDLVVVEKNKANEVKVGDYIFFYDTRTLENLISYAEVQEVEEIDKNEATYVLDGEYKISSEFLIGKDETSKKYENMGAILSALESRWGFLFFVIFPVLVLFIYEIYILIMELKSKK